MEASHIPMGDQRYAFHYTIVIACDNKDLHSLRLTLGVNFLDLLRAASFACSFGTLLMSVIKS